tara:strand:+ start:6212 stop:7039 length:828 start_codon:yes stop_codon:yes gene_type:complete
MSLYPFQSNTRTGESNKVFFPQQAVALHKFFIDRTFSTNLNTSYHLPNEYAVNDLHEIKLGDGVFTLKDNNQTIPYTSIGGTSNGGGNAYARSTVNGIPFDAEWNFAGFASLDKSTLSEKSSEAMCDVVVSGMTQICNTGNKHIQLNDRLIVRMPTRNEVASNQWKGRNHISSNGRLTLVVEPWTEFLYKKLTFAQLTTPDVSISDNQTLTLVKKMDLPRMVTELIADGTPDKANLYDEVMQRLADLRRKLKNGRMVATAQGSAKPGMDLQVVVH